MSSSLAKSMEHQQAYNSLDLVMQEIDDLLAAAPGSLAKTVVRAPVDAASIPHKFLLTSIGELKIALSMEDIGVIGALPLITPLPGLPSWISGIVNLRGEIVSVTNIADFLGAAVPYAGTGNRFVLLRSGKVKTIIVIDRMHGTVDKTVAEMTLPVSLDLVGRGAAGYVRPGFMAEGQPVHVLDGKAVLSSRRFLECRR